jgi:hypothetical protein
LVEAVAGDEIKDVAYMEGQEVGRVRRCHGDARPGLRCRRIPPLLLNKQELDVALVKVNATERY